MKIPFSLFIMMLLGLPACSALADDVSEGPAVTAQSYETIYWSDGDSGKLGAFKFRLANIDAPETRSPKQNGGAKCEAERAIGYAAKAFMIEFTKGKEIKVAHDYSRDRYKRLVVDLTADGVDVAKAGIEAGHLRPWPHKKNRAQAPKPDWCAQN